MKQRGFTLIELAVTLIVLAVLIAVAAPSVTLLRERQALRGAADNYVIAVGLAKQEAIKRNELVRVDFQALGGGACVGAAVVASVDGAGCDCSAAACDVSSFPDEPGDESELRGVSLDGAINFGGGTGFVFDPRTGTLADLSEAGELVLSTASGYSVAVRVNAVGRATTCVPVGASRILPGVSVCD